MLRDIDYAAVAVQRAIEEKYGRQAELKHLKVTAGPSSICVKDGRRSGEGSRDRLLSLVRKAASYDDLWQLLIQPAPAPGCGSES